MSRREEYIEQMKTQLDTWNAELDKLEERAYEFQGEAKERFEDRQQTIRRQLEEVKEKLQNLQKEGTDRWETMRNEIENLRSALVSSFNYFKSQV
jgi:uncharacterized protein YukE